MKIKIKNIVTVSNFKKSETGKIKLGNHVKYQARPISSRKMTL